MIVSQIIGGLGNQMFQYAAGFALANQRNQTLALDISGFLSYQRHNGFELTRIFSIDSKIASDGDLKHTLNWQAISPVKRLLLSPKFSFLRNGGWVVEPYFNHWEGLNQAPMDAYLVGYWQSEKYFKSIESAIRKNFSFKLPMSQLNQNIANLITKSNAVSLHVRRGDYATNASALAVHGLCTIKYYQEAIQLIAQQVKKPHFFIFSDDLLWVKGNLRINYPTTYVDHNTGAESYNDMRLMSLCKHHIIANSSFSWWGAWLNTNSDKIVVRPQNWFSDINKNTKDLLPDSWISLAG
jgi:hypothetical protein